MNPWHRMIRARFRPADAVGLDVLEMATGRGEWSHWLLGQPDGPRRLAAGDISLAAVAMARSRARERGLPDALWFVGDMQRLPFPDEAFGMVFSCETIEHLPSPREGVSELSRVLVAGGDLYLSVPNYLNLGLPYRIYRRLVGRPFQEAGQPINRLMTPVRVIWLLFWSDFRISTVDGWGQLVALWAGRPHLKIIERWDKIRGLRWFSVHQLFVARRRGGSV